MSWSKTLRDWALGEEEGAVTDAVAADLVGLLAALRTAGEQLEAHAQEAPTESAERELRQLAGEQQMAADRLAAELARRGVTVPAGSAVPASPSADSHWARLVQDLDLLRATRARLLDLWARTNQGPPEPSAVLEELSRVVESHLVRLRGLIARADPQALN